MPAQRPGEVPALYWSDIDFEAGTITATGTKLWQEVVWPEATVIHFYRHRIKFIRRDRKDDAMVSPQTSAIVAFGEVDAELLLKSGLPGVAIDMRADRCAARIGAPDHQGHLTR